MRERIKVLRDKLIEEREGGREGPERIPHKSIKVLYKLTESINYVRETRAYLRYRGNGIVTQDQC